MDEFFNIAWCEYLIKCYAWHRMDIEKWRHTRLIAYESKIGSHLDPKKLPKTIDKYLPLDNKKRTSSKMRKIIDAEKEKIRIEREQLRREKKL